MPGKSGKKSGQRKRRKAGQGQRNFAGPSTTDAVESGRLPATEERESNAGLPAEVGVPGSAGAADVPEETVVEQDSESVSAVESNSSAVSLRDAREARGISVDDVVRELNLSREVVLGLEAGDYEFLGAPVFVKGHLRRYARYLDVPEAALLDDLQAREPEPEEFRTLSRPRELKPGASLSSFVLWGLLLLLLLFGIGYLLLGDDEPAAPAAVELPAPVTESRPEAQPGPSRYTGSPGESPADAAGSSESARTPADASVAEVPDPEPVPALSAAAVADSQAEAQVQAGDKSVEAVPAAEVPVAAGRVSLVLRFSADCWVEVTDSNGRLIFGLQEAGSEASASAALPVSLLLGNAAGVTLEVAGLGWDIPRNNRGRSRTARFRIDSAALAAAKAELR